MTSSARAVELLRELVAVPSVNPAYQPDSPGESALARYVADFCESRGMTVTLSEVLDGRHNVVAVLEPAGETETRFAIEVHLDTVGLGEAGTQLTVRDGWAFGRGACDVKGGLAAALCALDELVTSGRLRRTRLELVGTIDEEDRYRGVLAHLATAQAADAVVVLEPTELRIVNAHRGVVRVGIEVPGRAAHTSRPELGRNAIVAAVRLVDALEEWRARAVAQGRDRIVTVTGITGGIARNIVPDSCSLDVDIRTTPDEDPADVLAELRAVAEEAAPGTRVSAVHVQDQGLATSPDHPLVRIAVAAAGAAPITVPFGTDASKFARAGVPAVVFGPGSIDDAHRDDERVRLADLERATEILLDIVRRWDSGGDA